MAGKFLSLPRVSTKKLLIVAFLAIVIIKFVAATVGSHPFDFATYVFQARSHFVYDMPAFFYWNKGAPLLAIFYSQYTIYDMLITIFNQGYENTLLAHIVFKLPHLFMDVMIGYFLYRIVIHTTQERKAALFALLLWLINPFVLWSSNLQGSYAIIASFFVILSLFLYIVKKRNILSIICLAISASIYYYAIVLAPFFIIKMIIDSRKSVDIGLAVKHFLIFSSTLALMYLPFFLTPGLAGDLTNSLMHHAAPDAPSSANEISLSNYSLLKLPYFFVTSDYATNLNAPKLFAVTNLMTFFGVGVIALMFFLRLRDCYKRGRYPLKSFLLDMVIVLITFMLFLGKFQNHYLVWIIPILITFAMIYSKQRIVWLLCFISVITLINIWSSGSQGIYFLDILSFGIVGTYLPFGDLTKMVSGFTILFLLIGCIYSAKTSGKNTKADLKFTVLLSSVLCVVFMYIGLLSVTAIIGSLNLKTHSSLASDQNVYSFAYDKKRFHKKSESVAYFDAGLKDTDFEDYNEDYISANSKISENSPWQAYNYKDASLASAQIVDVGYESTKSLKLSTQNSSGAIQLNMGSGGSGIDNSSYLPIEPYALYEASLVMKPLSGSLDNMPATVRFLDVDKNVISGSDIRLEQHESLADGWRRFNIEFPTRKDAVYVELTVTAKSNDNAQTEMLVDNINIRRKEVARTYYAEDVPIKSNSVSVKKYVLNSHDSVKNSYRLSMQFNRFVQYDSIRDVTINGCPVDIIPHKSSRLRFTASSDITCVNGTGGDSIEYTSINSKDNNPLHSATLVHNQQDKYPVVFNRVAYFVILAIAVIGTFSMLILVTYLYGKIYKGDDE